MDAVIAPAPPRRHRSSMEFCDSGAFLHWTIALAPLAYGIWRTAQGRQPSEIFWVIVLGIIGFQIFVHRKPYLRVTANGIAFPRQRNALVQWEEMRIARARDRSIVIELIDGEEITIKFDQMKARDVPKLEAIIKQQFAAMAAQ